MAWCPTSHKPMLWPMRMQFTYVTYIIYVIRLQYINAECPQSCLWKIKVLVRLVYTYLFLKTLYYYGTLKRYIYASLHICTYICVWIYIYIYICISAILSYTAIFIIYINIANIAEIRICRLMCEPISNIKFTEVQGCGKSCLFISSAKNPFQQQPKSKYNCKHIRAKTCQKLLRNWNVKRMD